MVGDGGRGRTHHEEVAPGHPDGTDVREGLHDVVECGGGEGVDTLRGIGWDGVLCQLTEMHPVRAVRTLLLPSTSSPEPPRVSASPLRVPGDPRPQGSVNRTCGHTKTWRLGDAMCRLSPAQPSARAVLSAYLHKFPLPGLQDGSRLLLTPADVMDLVVIFEVLKELPRAHEEEHGLQGLSAGEQAHTLLEPAAVPWDVGMGLSPTLDSQERAHASCSLSRPCSKALSRLPAPYTLQNSPTAPLPAREGSHGHWMRMKEPCPKPSWGQVPQLGIPALQRTHRNSLPWESLVVPPKISSSCQRMNFLEKPWQPPESSAGMSGL